MCDPENALGLWFGHGDASSDTDDGWIVDVEEWNPHLGAYVLVPEEKSVAVEVECVEVNDQSDAASGRNFTDSPSSYGSIIDRPQSNTPPPFAFTQPNARPLSPFQSSTTLFNSANASPTRIVTRFVPQLSIIIEELESQSPVRPS